MRAAQILHARMDFLGCPYSIHPHGLLAYGRGVASHGFGLDLVVGAESGEFKLAIKIERPFCGSARPFLPALRPFLPA
jgi:hypothetical protein